MATKVGRRLKKMARLVHLMPHEERQRLIHMPIPWVRVLPHSYRWGGTHIAESVPTEGRRVWRVTPADEEVLMNIHREQD